MKRLFTKFAPFLAIFGIAVAIFAILRGKKTGAYIDQFKALFMSAVMYGMASYAIYDLVYNNSTDMVMIAVVWGTVGASVTGTFSFNFVPQFIEFVTATSPSLVQVNVNGDGMIFNLDTLGLLHMQGIRTYARQANTFMYQIADGLLNNKNGTVTITTGVSACTIRAWSPNKNGTFYCTFNPAQALASQAYNLTSFAYATFPSAATTDSYQLSYNDGSLDNLTREELGAYISYFEATGTAKFSVDNIAPARISQVTFSPTAAQAFYVMKYQSAFGGVVNANPNV